MPIDPRSSAYPDDWIYPDDWTPLPRFASPDTSQAALSSPPSALNTGSANPFALPSANPSAIRPDPFAAYWAQVPASRLTALAWEPPSFPPPNPFSPENIPVSKWVTPPPIFPNALGQYPFSAPAPRDVQFPTTGLFGGLADPQPATTDAPAPWTGLLGGLASRPANKSWSLLGSLDDLARPPPSTGFDGLSGAGSGTSFGNYASGWLSFADRAPFGALSLLPYQPALSSGAAQDVPPLDVSQVLLGASGSPLPASIDASVSALGPLAGMADRPPSFAGSLENLSWSSPLHASGGAGDYQAVSPEITGSNTGTPASHASSLRPFLPPDSIWPYAGQDTADARPNVVLVGTEHEPIGGESEERFEKQIKSLDARVFGGPNAAGMRGPSTFVPRAASAPPSPPAGQAAKAPAVDSPVVEGGLSRAEQLKARRGAQLQVNKAAGGTFEKATETTLNSKELELGSQVSIKGPSGTRTRLDFITRDRMTGEIGCVECKGSPTARFTPNQTQVFREMEQNETTIVGKGKPGFPGGTKIPPIDVEIKRPGD